MLGLLVSRKWMLCNQLQTIPYKLNCANVQSSITSFGLVASVRLVLLGFVIKNYSFQTYSYDYIPCPILGSSTSLSFVVKSMNFSNIVLFFSFNFFWCN